MKIIFSKECLEYGNGHIESKERVAVAKKILKSFSYEFLKPELIKQEKILKVHSKEYLNKLKKGETGDADTPVYNNIYQYARLSAGGALLASEVGGFSFMRPPGHHVGRNGAALNASTKGFCYLNNIAIAVRNLNKKTLILDIDGHHGNGTQEIFQGDKKVDFISLHGEFFYPGTGKKSYENCINVPLSANCGEKKYIHAFKKALKQIDFKKIEAIAVSAGFDGHENDLASLGLTVNSFEKIGEIIRKLNKHTFFVLEGGYVGENLGKDINALLKSFSFK